MTPSSRLHSVRSWWPSTRSGSGCPVRRTPRPTPSDPTCDKWVWPRPLCCRTWWTWQTATGTWRSTTAFPIQTSPWWNCCWTPVSVPPPLLECLESCLRLGRTCRVCRSVWDGQHEQGGLHPGDAGRADGCRQLRRPGGGAAVAEAGQRGHALQTGDHNINPGFPSLSRGWRLSRMLYFRPRALDFDCTQTFICFHPLPSAPESFHSNSLHFSLALRRRARQRSCSQWATAVLPWWSCSLAAPRMWTCRTTRAPRRWCAPASTGTLTSWACCWRRAAATSASQTRCQFRARSWNAWR